MKVWSLYSIESGRFTGRVVSGSESVLADNLQPGQLAMEGRYDRICQKVDLKTGAVVDSQPPAPGEDFEWRAEHPDASDRAKQRWRWLKKPTVLERESRRDNARLRIEELEGKQHRRARELLEELVLELRGQPDPRLKALSQEIAALRADLSQPPESA